MGSPVVPSVVAPPLVGLPVLPLVEPVVEPLLEPDVEPPVEVPVLPPVAVPDVGGLLGDWPLDGGLEVDFVVVGRPGCPPVTGGRCGVGGRAVPEGEEDFELLLEGFALGDDG